MDIDLPSVGHFFYIPGMLLLGLSVGFRLGAKAVREEFERQRRDRME